MKNETYELNRELFNSTTGQSASIHVEEIDQKNLSKMGIELVNILDGLNLNENLIDDGVSIFKETSDIFNEKMNGVLVSDYRISHSKNGDVFEKFRIDVKDVEIPCKVIEFYVLCNGHKTTLFTYINFKFYNESYSNFLVNVLEKSWGREDAIINETSDLENKILEMFKNKKISDTLKNLYYLSLNKITLPQINIR